ncbi:bifunctional 4-hydroxy-2-oxoglutarate aldolase/2-dehydro-3-deoxy-phosphogluconate aldolase [Nocardioides marmoriginsengisoli]|uniref:2-dehydro-3-deoxy-phosphogluconate aldolase n=1 Tax=Nocardioides marmoriginsengisoli TaxID=661483 RepID=A0A3N0CG00_9ACTN|nr:bifunctional 4-hydroxy-2-oxoglutarate aldolase/2-dehydro-3-deoxy-phosphogluconate aldolase [Nocardioides marmoriginsengisoli]RNL62151.1 bifunctional 4-hydroxy-2-oxoglutarate aldolase/2-dehydro-3-deoxy-phosphogluconate aldolase [Nocardioides marmoriginsengisoli]
MSAAVALLRDRGTLPVVVADDAGIAAGLGEALKAGGITCAEITLRTPAGWEVLAALAADDALLVGAGTVLDTEQVDRAVDAGARFLVSPGFDPVLVERAQERGVPMVPGVATATEVQAARRAGLEAVKLFPAEAGGGLPALRALAEPFPGMWFLPTGGITAETAPAWWSHPQVLCVGGSWVARRDQLAAGDLDAVRAAAAAATEAYAAWREGAR